MSRKFLFHNPKVCYCYYYYWLLFYMCVLLQFHEGAACITKLLRFLKAVIESCSCFSRFLSVNI
uniref:Uncharacterized protein n=1 Tax=Rhizophora mucronata TaxID=61149 RepID=A0A2P2R3U7_RHIMU